MAVGDDGDVGRWCQVLWMVVGRKSLLIIDGHGHLKTVLIKVSCITFNGLMVQQ